MIILAKGVAVMMVLMIVAHDGFRDEEYFKPKALLESAGYSVVTGSTLAGPARGKLGGKARADIALADVRTTDYAAVVFVGGPGAYDYYNDRNALRIAREAVGQDLTVGAICSAPGILARAGVLKGKKATVFPSDADELRRAGAFYREEPVVVTGKLVTANGPAAAEQFGRELVKLLNELNASKNSQTVQ